MNIHLSYAGFLTLGILPGCAQKPDASTPNVVLIFHG
jgi:hypothetical protein